MKGCIEHTLEHRVCIRSYPVFMTRTTIEIDDEALAGAARELGTTTKVDTVNAALAFVAKRHQLARSFDDPSMWGSPELSDPKIRKTARR